MNSNSSSSFYHVRCANSLQEVYISTAYTITRTVLVLPLCLLILYLGYKRWRQQCSFAMMSHSDIFTYQMMALELILALGYLALYAGRQADNKDLMVVGYHLLGPIIPGQMGFHSLTCVERYLAVVHPVLYLKLKHSGGVKIRNVSSLCVWLLAFTWSALMVLFTSGMPDKGYFCLMFTTLAVISFCSLRVLCVLISPGPGEVSRDRDRVGQSKKRAFYTIMTITAVLWMWFTVGLVALALDKSALVNKDAACLSLLSANWFSLPSDLSLPLLYLHRNGLCCNLK